MVDMQSHQSGEILGLFLALQHISEGVPKSWG